ncbi:hypothetical protein F511_24862 [Dorcoceras hygrometricum]|uniref:Uncharacterized protein n=1 Tax=Dorcoceras hygrometricum TaxID=472368 RepID=A0A2Z7AKP0_9LAMI|nr:hypothetical protein F511_24862 [Dorcoceras hygrometricum]
MLRWQEATATLTWISDVGVLVARISRQRYRTLKRRRFGEQEPAVGFVSASLSSDQPLSETTSFWEFSSCWWSRYTFTVEESDALFNPAAGLGDQPSTDMMTCPMRRRLVSTRSLGSLVVVIVLRIKMPPRRRARGRGQFQESEGQNEDRRSAPSRTRSRHDEEEEVGDFPTLVERMDVILPIRSTTRTETPSSGCTRSTDEFCMNGFSSSSWPKTIFRRRRAAAAAAAFERGGGGGIQLAVGPQPLRLRNHNSGSAQRIMVKRLATSPHDPLGITGSSCKNQSVVVSVQYGPFNPYIPIRSTTIGKSRVAIDPIAMHTSWRSNSDIESVTR